MLDRFSHLGFVFFEDVNVDIRGDFSIAMTEVLGNCLNVISVVDKQAGVAMSESVNAQRPHIIFNQHFFQLLVSKASAVVITNFGPFFTLNYKNI